MRVHFTSPVGGGMVESGVKVLEAPGKMVVGGLVEKIIKVFKPWG